MSKAANGPVLDEARPEKAMEEAERIGPYSFPEWVEMVRRFHSYPAPGVLIGGIMVDELMRRMPEGVLYDAIAETSWCLPDAIQMLTPCTIGNGWLRVVNFGVYGLSLFDKRTGQGFRAVIDPETLKDRPCLRDWLLKLKPKKDQDSPGLRREIETMGRSALRVEPVAVRGDQLVKRSKGAITLCPICGDAYPAVFGAVCRACQGESPYLSSRTPNRQTDLDSPPLTAVSVEEAVGVRVLHDMTRVEPGTSKGAAFHRGQTITAGDVCRLQRMGRFHVYVGEIEGEDWVHENKAASLLARGLAGDNIGPAGAPREGKINLAASTDGMLVLDSDRLEALNLVPDVMAACRKSYSLVRKGMKVAGTRAIPLYISRDNMEKALRVLSAGPIIHVRPLAKAKVGVLVTGNEVYKGLIEDRFAPIISGKTAALGSEVIRTIIAPDDADAIQRGAGELLDAGCDLIVTTAGLSVDPDDVTRKGMLAAGLADALYGAPVLPGSMLLLGRLGAARVIGVPACALFFKTTAFDLVLPRVLAGVEITRRDLARLGNGGMCMECKTCAFPKCPFGK